MRRSARVLVVVAGLVGPVAACGGKSEAPAADAEVGEAAAAEASAQPLPLPSTAEAFLARLAPIPEGAVRIRYALSGPAGSEGELVVVLAEGGRRDERWEMRLPNEEGEPTRLTGRSVMRPELSWTREGESAGRRAPLPLADIAAHYLAATPEQQAKWMGEIDAWHTALREARAEAPGERAREADIDCLRMQVAGQSLCLWEETGLPLSIRGAAFEIEASEVQTGFEPDAAQFELPPQAAEAEMAEAPAELSLSPEDFFTLLERRDAQALGLVLTPGLRLPDPSALADASDPPR